MPQLPPQSCLFVILMIVVVGCFFVAVPASAQIPVTPSDANKFSWFLPNKNSPDARAYHSLSPLPGINNAALLFAGGSIESNSSGTYYVLYDDLWMFNVTSNIWSEIYSDQSTQPPPPRAGHSACVFSDSDGLFSLVVFGGFKTQHDGKATKVPVDSNSSGVVTWIYNFGINHWHPLETNSGPSPRFGAAATCSNNSMYIFGGLVEDFKTAPNDLWVFSYLTFSWTLLSNATNTSAPSEVSSFGSFAQPSENVTAPMTTLLPSNPSHAIGAPTMHFAQLGNSTVPKSRGFAGAAVVDNKFVLFGGFSGRHEIENNTWIFSLSNGTWVRSNSSQTPPFSAMVALVIDDRVFSIGGTKYPNAVSITAAYFDSIYPESNSRTWIYFPRSDHWDEAPRPNPLASYVGRIPTARHGLAAVRVEQVTLLFGGVSTSSFTFWDDIWLVSESIEGALLATELNPLSSPSGSAGSTWTQSGQSLYLFGGWSQDVLEVTPMWTYNYSSQTWLMQMNWENSPDNRALHTASLIGNEIYLYGGLTTDEDGTWYYFEDLWTYNVAASLNENPWSNISMKNAPGPRAAHGACSHGNGFYIFGGKNYSVPLGDLYYYNLSSSGQKFEKLVSSNMPRPRWGHQFERISDFLVVFGGQSAYEIYNDCWIFNVSDRTWTEAYSLYSSAFRPPPLTFYSAVSTSTKMIIYGGARNSTDDPDSASISRKDLFDFSNSVYEFYLPTRSWTELAIQNAPLDSRIMVSAAFVQGSTLVTFGGATENTYTNDLYTAQIGCNAGYYSMNYATEPCLPCPFGRYAPSAGASACQGVCPGSTTTSVLGATSILQCDTCLHGTCNGHGDCSVTSDFEVSCSCRFGFRGSDDCKFPFDYVIIAASVGSTLLVVLVAYAIKRYRSQTAHAYTLLESSKREVDDLASIWQIPWGEIRLVRRIDKGSEGAYGDVWLGEWAGRQVAVKKLKEAMVQLSMWNATITANFEREIKLLRQLRHSKIVFFYGAGHHNDAPYLVTEFMARGSLYLMLKNPEIDISTERRLRFALDAAEGLAFLHTLRPARIHRDIKSANFLVGEDWTLKISDFGTANLISKLQLDTQKYDPQAFPLSSSSSSSPRKVSLLTTQVGSLLWMAPEMLKGQPYDSSADIYSYGIVMWEMLTRRLPYDHIHSEGSHMVQSFIEQGGRPEYPRELTYDPYVLLMSQCWDDHPLNRPTASEVVTKLNEILMTSSKTSSSSRS